MLVLPKQDGAFLKPSTLPPVQIEPSFRVEMESSLHPDESLASLVETAVRSEVKRRQDQAEFLRRGIASIQRTAVAGDGIPASRVIARLEAKLALAKKSA